jgi:hypothetical protein
MPRGLWTTEEVLTEYLNITRRARYDSRRWHELRELEPARPSPRSSSALR